MALLTGILFTEPRNKPISAAGQFQPGATRQFFLVDGVTLATVYRDANLTLPFSQSPVPITAGGDGRFPEIYLDPTVVYRAQLFSAAGVQLEDVNPYIPLAYRLITIVKPGTTGIVNNTVLRTDTDLQVLLPAAGTYVFEAALHYGAVGTGATPGLSFAFAMANATNTSAYHYDGFAGSDVGGSAPVNTSTPLSLSGGSAINTLIIRGVIECTAPGVFALQWGQQNTSAGSVNLLAGSVLVVQQIL